jgi:hypothetical protein
VWWWWWWLERDESEKSKFDLSFFFWQDETELEMYRLYIILSACLRNVYTHTHTTKEEKKMRDKCWPSQKKKKKSCFSGRGVIDMCVHYRNFVFSSFFICRLAAGPHNAIVYTVTLNRRRRRLYGSCTWMLYPPSNDS